MPSGAFREAQDMQSLAKKPNCHVPHLAMRFAIIDMHHPAVSKSKSAATSNDNPRSRRFPSLLRGSKAMRT
jgi:hypothetical protein